MKAKHPLNPEVWEYLKQLRPDPPRNITGGRFTVITKETLARRVKEGRPGLARHERVIEAGA